MGYDCGAGIIFLVKMNFWMRSDVADEYDQPRGIGLLKAFGKKNALDKLATHRLTLDKTLAINMKGSTIGFFRSRSGRTTVWCQS